MRRDPLSQQQPHTPHVGFVRDSVRPTCSETTERNKGCDQWEKCNLLCTDNGSAVPIKGRQTSPCGPVQVVIQDRRGLGPEDEGRRIPMWCFGAFLKYAGPAAKNDFSISLDPMYHESVPVSEKHPRGGVRRVRLPPLSEQGPYYWPATAAAPSPSDFIDEETPVGNQGNDKPGRQQDGKRNRPRQASTGAGI